jgi:hypothetical protein
LLPDYASQLGSPTRRQGAILIENPLCNPQQTHGLRRIAIQKSSRLVQQRLQVCFHPLRFDLLPTVKILRGITPSLPPYYHGH